MNDNSNNKNIGLKVALALVSIVLIISLVAVFYVYTNPPDTQDEISSLQNQIASLENQITDLQSQLNQLQSTYDNYVASHSHSNSEYDALVSEIDSLKKPDLVTRLGLMDERPFLQTSYLHVFGEVWNVGTNTATNCKLHVILYQGAVVAEDTYINLGTILGKDYTSVDSPIYYEGSELTSWSISPEWD